MSVVMQHISDNNSPNIHFSDTAISHLIAYLNKDKSYLGIRLSVKKTGCSGLSYVIDYVKESPVSDLRVALSAEYCVWIDKSSYPFLKNMNVDYVKHGLNHKFIFNNPNQTGQCGCGESFTVA